MGYNQIKMTLKQGLQFCKRIAKNASDDSLKYIKLEQDGVLIKLTATDQYRIVSVLVIPDESTNIKGFLHIDDVSKIKTIDDLKKYVVKISDYPDLPIFKFSNYIKIELEPLRRFCKMYKDKDIDIRIAGREFALSYRDNEIKTSILIKYIKSNIKYYRTRLNAKLLLEILPRDNTIKIKVGKSGRDPISFDNQIIMPITIKTSNKK